VVLQLVVPDARSAQMLRWAFSGLSARSALADVVMARSVLQLVRAANCPASSVRRAHPVRG
jgi:hypothetical protein